MPRGYYLAQGLIPLGYSSSDDEEGPCELPNGRLVCGPHGLVVCGRCCTDYSFMDDVLDDDDEEGSEAEENDDVGLDFADTPEDILRCLNAYSGNGMVRGTGKVFPSKFVPSNSKAAPLEEFPNGYRHIEVVRRTHSNDNTKLLLMTDGACLNNGQPNPRAGWAFFQGELITGEPQVVSGRLENHGPWGDEAGQTSNRAELRAVLGALRHRAWHGEGFKTVVIATDSSYVVDGATQWVKGWVKNGWKTKGGADVKNKDLWEMLLGECERAQGNGLAIQFWHIPREWNTLADAGARRGAAEGDAPERFADIIGMAF